MLTKQYSTWLEIDLNAIRKNLRSIQQLTHTQVMAVVKANGYGHGAVHVARAAIEAGATWCGVGRIDEALQLREAGLNCPILLLGYAPPEAYEIAIMHKIDLTVWEADQILWAEKIAKRIGKPVQVHLKIDTGMNRIGAPPAKLTSLLDMFQSATHVCLQGAYTHFARADEEDPRPTNEQERLFLESVEKLKKGGHQIPWIHVANSAASLTRPQTNYSMVRVGIALYGLNPSKVCPLPNGFSPALSWKSVLSHVKTLPPGHGVSYGHEYVTQKHERIGTVPVGYADGFRRMPGNWVLVQGKRVAVRGRVCMDQIMVSLDEVPEAQVGDEVVIIGAQGNEQISAEEVAARWRTVNYEVVCGISARVPRVYFGEE